MTINLYFSRYTLKLARNFSFGLFLNGSQVKSIVISIEISE